MQSEEILKNKQNLAFTNRIAISELMWKLPVEDRWIFMNDIDTEFIRSLDLKVAIGLSVTEEDYANYIKDIEGFVSGATRCGYILVKHTGKFNFFHYSRGETFTEVNPSTYENNSNLSFGEGVYCFNANEHEPVIGPMTKMYVGEYYGDYLECVFDDDGNGIKDKCSGNSKEYLLLTKGPIPVKLLNLDKYKKELKMKKLDIFKQ